MNNSHVCHSIAPSIAEQWARKPIEKGVGYIYARICMQAL